MEFAQKIRASKKKHRVVERNRDEKVCHFEQRGLPSYEQVNKNKPESGTQ